MTEEERRQRMEQLVKARLEEREKDENFAQQRTGGQLSNRYGICVGYVCIQLQEVY